MLKKKANEIWRQYKNNGLISVANRILLYGPKRGIIWRTRLSRLSYGIDNNPKRETKVVVSLTSYPQRFRELYLCVKSLLLQSFKPDKIIIWFGSDTSINDLTESLIMLQQYGVEYRFDNEKDLKPHKKYYYAIQEFPDDIVITVDDDVIYSRNTINSLMKSYYNHPRAISARRVHKMTFSNNTVNSYNDWKREYRVSEGERNDLMAIGVGGVLYPPHSLNPKAFDSDAITRLCLNADDIWLKCMEILEGTRVVWVPCLICHPPSISNHSGLSNSNTINNDSYLKRLMDVYSIKTIDFCE